MILLNFAHPLTPDHLAAVETLTGAPIARVIQAQSQFEAGQPFAPQAQALVARVGLTPEEWQTLPLLLNLPSLSSIAALVLAEIHGRAGYFPAVLRLRPVPESVPPQWDVAEIVDLQAVREAGRRLRQEE